MLLKNSSICGDNKLLGTIPESLGVVWKGLCFTCFKCVNKSLLMQHGEKLLLLHCLPTSCGPMDFIASLPQDPQILLGVSSYWSSALLLAVFVPSPPYLSWLPIIAAQHCRGTSNTELCMLLWLKQTKRISLFKELMLGFCIQRSQSRGSVISSVLWMAKLKHEEMKWICLLDDYSLAPFASHLTAHVLGQSPIMWHTAQTQAKPKKQGILWY